MIKVFCFCILLVSCQAPQEKSLDRQMLLAMTTYTFITKYSTDSLLIDTVFKNYLDSLKIPEKQFNSVKEDFARDLIFRKKVLVTIKNNLDSADILDHTFGVFKKIQQADSVKSAL